MKATRLSGLSRCNLIWSEVKWFALKKTYLKKACCQNCSYLKMSIWRKKFNTLIWRQYLKILSDRTSWSYFLKNIFWKESFWENKIRRETEEMKRKQDAEKLEMKAWMDKQEEAIVELQKTTVEIKYWMVKQDASSSKILNLLNLLLAKNS